MKAAQLARKALGVWPARHVFRGGKGQPALSAAGPMRWLEAALGRHKDFDRLLRSPAWAGGALHNAAPSHVTGAARAAFHA